MKSIVYINSASNSISPLHLAQTMTKFEINPLDVTQSSALLSWTDEEYSQHINELIVLSETQDVRDALYLLARSFEKKLETSPQYKSSSVDLDETYGANFIDFLSACLKPYSTLFEDKIQTPRRYLQTPAEASDDELEGQISLMEQGDGMLNRYGYFSLAIDASIEEIYAATQLVETGEFDISPFVRLYDDVILVDII